MERNGDENFSPQVVEKFPAHAADVRQEEETVAILKFMDDRAPQSVEFEEGADGAEGEGVAPASSAIQLTPVAVTVGAAAAGAGISKNEVDGADAAIAKM
jgi:hypothetical protein